jgi:hypothetical protein
VVHITMRYTPESEKIPGQTHITDVSSLSLAHVNHVSSFLSPGLSDTTMPRLSLVDEPGAASSIRARFAMP